MVDVVGPATREQAKTLKKRKVIRSRRPLTEVGAQCVRWQGKTWIGFPAVRAGSWKLWGITEDGRVHPDRSSPASGQASFPRINLGPTSFIAPRKLPKTPERLYDVEGESDLLAALDAGLKAVICSTGGAGASKPYTAEADWIKEVAPGEVVVVRDLDVPGEHGYEVGTAAYHQLGIPVIAPRLPKTLGPGGDLRDFLRGHSLADLELLIDATPLLKPGAVVGGIPTLSPYLRSGSTLEAVLEQPTPHSPLPDFLDPDPHLHILTGSPKAGKTSFAINLALAWATGAAPWTQALPIPRGRVLIVSNEQPTIRLVQLMARLHDHLKRRVPTEERFNNVYIFAKDQTDLGARRALQLDDEHGLPALRGALQDAADTGEEFRLLVLDSLSRLKPAGVSENDNDEMTVWLDKFESIALDFKVWIILIHHTGHAERGDPRHRIVRVAGSMLEDSTHRFMVCGPEEPASHIDFFRIASAAEGLEPSDYIDPGEELNATELDWRISGEDRSKKPDRDKLSRPKREQTAAVRREWEDQGAIRQRKGKGTTKLYSLELDSAKRRQEAGDERRSGD